jgi:hypothetical protein
VVGLKQIAGFSSLLPYQPEFDDKRTTVQLNLSAALVASQRQRAGDEERFPGVYTGRCRNAGGAGD